MKTKYLKLIKYIIQGYGIQKVVSIDQLCYFTRQKQFNLTHIHFVKIASATSKLIERLHYHHNDHQMKFVFWLEKGKFPD